MSRKYKIRNQDQLHFVSFTVVHWIDVFIRNEYKEIFLESVRHCQKQKGLEVFAWVIMTSHVHMILRAKDGYKLQDIIRDMKSHVSMQIRKQLENRDAMLESRREWMFWMMQHAGAKNGNNNDYQFWQQHNHPIELNSNALMDQKLDYIHQNPVEAGFVQEPEYWMYSSAIDYSGGKGLLEIQAIY